MDTGYFKELAHFIDRLRFSRGMTQEDFVFDIVSVRQYRRYLSGVSKIPQDIMHAFAQKLGFKPEHIILDFESARIRETKKITAFYNAVINDDHVKADSIKKQIIESDISDNNNKKLYLYGKYLQEYRQSKMSEHQIVHHVKELIDYPEILKTYKLSSAEIILLSALLGYRSFSDKKQIADRLISVVSDDSQIISGYNERVKFLCLQRLADYYGTLKKFDAVIGLCDMAIGSLVEIKSYYLMDYFYYFKALAHYYLNDINRCKESLYRCHCILQSENNPSKINKFVKMCKKDLNLSLDDVAFEHLNHELKAKKAHLKC